MAKVDNRPKIELDGESLTIEQLVSIARDPDTEVSYSKEAEERVLRAALLIKNVAEQYEERYLKIKEVADDDEVDPERWEKLEEPILDYGITTGFGEFKDIAIEPKKLKLLQRNILLSHAVGVGENTDWEDPSNYFPADVVRATLVIRLNTFLHGNSGVRLEIVDAIVAMLNEGIVPLVPLKGSVGSSGDLCPLCHLFVTFLQEGFYYVVEKPEDLRYQQRALAVAPEASLEPEEIKKMKGMLKPAAYLTKELSKVLPKPSFKEGLALSNGATFSAAILALAVYDAERTATIADAATAMSLEAVCGCARAFDAKIHQKRYHQGQIESAANIRELLANSSLMERKDEVQDAYSLRCAPQVHGASRDAIAYARMVAAKEIKAVTDNPLLFPNKDGTKHDHDPWDFEFRGNWQERKDKKYNGQDRVSYSAGNFHGQPIGLAADFLAMALAELADISERRIQLLLDGNHNRGLPANLIPHGGVNSGFMIAQYSAASLVSENKILTHPASVDSIPTSANSEDHNSMATIAARKLRTVLGNCQAVLAIEFMVATQAIEWRAFEIKYPKTSLKAANGPDDDLDTVRKRWEKKMEKEKAADKQFEDFKLLTDEHHREEIRDYLGSGTRLVYDTVRGKVTPMLEDRTLDKDILKIRLLIENHVLFENLQENLEKPLHAIQALMSPNEPRNRS